MSNGRPGEGRPLESNRRLEQARDSSPAAPPATHRETSRTHSRPDSALPEPVIISEFWANRRGESVRVQLSEFEGRVLVDVRRHYTDKEGKLRPTRKGISIAVTRLTELAGAINQAVAKARELGLIDKGAP
jgi:hypothetical protein